MKLIDQQESQRDYDQDIAKLEKERNDIQGQYNLLLLDNSHEAKSKRKKIYKSNLLKLTRKFQKNAMTVK